MKLFSLLAVGAIALPLFAGADNITTAGVSCSLLSGKKVTPGSSLTFNLGSTSSSTAVLTCSYPANSAPDQYTLTVQNGGEQQNNGFLTTFPKLIPMLISWGVTKPYQFPNKLTGNPFLVSFWIPQGASSVTLSLK